MILTAQQLTAVKAAVVADPVLNAFPNNSDGNFEVAARLNLPASPNYWVWRTAVARADIYNVTSDLPSDWDWTLYKNQGVAEQNAWVQMFMGDQADFSKANLRAGVAKIFGAGNANNAHVLAVARRLARRIEQILATGTGSTATPATMNAEGTITGDQVDLARHLP